jgi:hypothetical protein
MPMSGAIAGMQRRQGGIPSATRFFYSLVSCNLGISIFRGVFLIGKPAFPMDIGTRKYLHDALGRIAKE